MHTTIKRGSFVAAAAQAVPIPGDLVLASKATHSGARPVSDLTAAFGDVQSYWVDSMHETACVGVGFTVMGA